jgi:hypothetical protein
VIDAFVVVMVPRRDGPLGGEERSVHGHRGFDDRGRGGPFVAMPPPLRVAKLPVTINGLPDTPVIVNVPRRPL